MVGLLLMLIHTINNNHCPVFLTEPNTLNKIEHIYVHVTNSSSTSVDSACCCKKERNFREILPLNFDLSHAGTACDSLESTKQMYYLFPMWSAKFFCLSKSNEHLMSLSVSRSHLCKVTNLSLSLPLSPKSSLLLIILNEQIFLTDWNRSINPSDRQTLSVGLCC